MNAMMPLVMLLAFLSSIVLPVAGVVALVTYVRRNRRGDRWGGDGYLDDRVLDGLDQLHLRLDAINERLARLEQAQGIRGAPPGDALQPGRETDPPDA